MNICKIYSSFCLALIAACASTPRASAPAAKAPAPAFQLPDAEANAVALSDFKGKLVIVDFWASWCEPCKDAMPFYAALQKKYAGRLVVLGVSVDESKEALDTAISERHPSFVILHDAKGEVAEQYGVSGMPSSYLVDASGNIVYTHHGFVESDKEEIERIVAANLPVP